MSPCESKSNVGESLAGLPSTPLCYPSGRDLEYFEEIQRHWA
ncbi:hypothetical protein PDE_08505 [Penicillium oxalicum 114-2]|uniref:Uncharacterized protein n=1 Tax=Penicillium oxalicum (strain 114-2 / CGMCC 5302) TaxID=933388 RepID=S8B402_PENO1|nr:hypothetical protein PDE_08505 [Penicillium oxalicum 114-2]